MTNGSNSEITASRSTRLCFSSHLKVTLCNGNETNEGHGHKKVDPEQTHTQAQKQVKHVLFHCSSVQVKNIVSGI